MHLPGELYESLRTRVTAFSRKSKHLFDGDADALHHTRVASRRLRELLPVLHLDADTARKLRRRLRNVSRRLGVVRDFDVLMRLVSELQGQPQYSRNALGELETAFTEARRAACEDLEAKLPPRKLRRLTRRLKRVVKDVKPEAGREPPHHPSRAARASVWAIEALVVRRAAWVGDAVSDAGTVYAPQRLHALRGAVKKLRFALELQGEARGDRAVADIAALKRSQDLLGRLHDFQVLIEHARRLRGGAAQATPDRASNEVVLLIRGLEQHCRQLHARYLRGASKLQAIVLKLGNLPSHASPGAVVRPGRAMVGRRLA